MVQAGGNSMSDTHDLVIVGAGQAGLAISRELARRGLEHIVLERGRVGETWRGRWDSFCLVTPNWSMQLPDQPYDGEDPVAFDSRDEIVGFLERYAARFEVPVHEGVAVRLLLPREAGGFLLETSAGPVEAQAVVLATGAFQRPTRLAPGSTLPADLLQLDVGDYRNPAELPAGPVLVVGSGQSGCQIAEELAESGRDVYLSCGRAPWLPRRIGEHDFIWWLKESGFLDATVGSLPEPSARLWANVLASGRHGGHDLHLRTLHEMGVVLLGHLAGIDGRRARFRLDLSESVAWGDQRHAQLLELFRTFAVESKIPKPEPAEPARLDHDPKETLDLKGFAAVVHAGGFRPDYESWVRIPGAFDELGFPIHEEGASTVVDGLYFVGVHFLRKRRSGTFLGFGEDAAIVARTLATRSARAASPRLPLPRGR
jgi:glycine/D-amino acid oxidase-like deaminating enzyme